MTRKDYVRLAEALRATRPTAGNGGEEYRALQWSRDILAVAYALRDDNSRFDLNRFETACGVERDGERA